MKASIAFATWLTTTICNGSNARDKSGFGVGCRVSIRFVSNWLARMVGPLAMAISTSRRERSRSLNEPQKGAKGTNIQGADCGGLELHAMPGHVRPQRYTERAQRFTRRARDVY